MAPTPAWARHPRKEKIQGPARGRHRPRHRTLAAYGRPGDYFRFYEINPLVLRLARTEFTFLGDCKAKLEVAMGDARLSLEREAPENFDVLAVDAFSSDSIPVHLFTREAMDVYYRHSQPDGVLAVQFPTAIWICRRCSRVRPRPPEAVAQVVDNDDDDTQGGYSAQPGCSSPGRRMFRGEIIRSSNQIAATRKVRLWTDDYSNLFQILKIGVQLQSAASRPSIFRKREAQVV